jgi:hypothetical protein
VLLRHAIVFRAALEFDRQLERWRSRPDTLALDDGRSAVGVHSSGHDWMLVQTGR